MKCEGGEGEIGIGRRLHQHSVHLGEVDLCVEYIGIDDHALLGELLGESHMSSGGLTGAFDDMLVLGSLPRVGKRRGDVESDMLEREIVVQ